MGRSSRKSLRRSAGYILPAVIVYGWFFSSMGAAVIATLSATLVGYSLFAAPVWCCAETRAGDFCRNDAYGVLMGCHLRQHKWQKLKMVVKHELWSKLLDRPLSGIGGRAASLSALAGTVSAVVALGTFLFK